jgi:hypothetical protein
MLNRKPDLLMGQGNNNDNNSQNINQLMAKY